MDIIKKQAQAGTLTVPIGHERVHELAKILFHVNQLVPFPKSDAELEDWARSLLSFSPNFDSRKLVFLINEFKLGRIEWQKDVGIQNITMNLQLVDETHSGFRLKAKISY